MFVFKFNVVINLGIDGGEEDEVLWPHHPEERHGENIIILMQGKVGGQRRRGRPATAWFQDLKEWTKLDIAAASYNWRLIGKDGEKSSKSQQRR